MSSVTTPAMFNSNGPGKAHPFEKVIRLALLGILGYAGIKAFNWLAPTLITFFTNIYMVVGLGLPLLFILGWAISNKGLIWMTYKGWCRKITEFFISIDFLSYIDSYIEILQKKLGNLKRSKDQLAGRYKAFQGNIEKKRVEAERNLKLAAQARKNGDEATAGHLGSLAATSKQSIARMEPVALRMEKNLLLLDKVEENWEFSIEKLKHEVSVRREEYLQMKEAAETLGNVEKFMNGESEESRIFFSSLQQLDNNLAQSIAKIEAFEKRSKNMITQIDLEKQMNSDEGLLLLDQFEQHGMDIFLPTDYSKHAIPVEAQVVSSKPLQQSSFGNLLKRK